MGLVREKVKPYRYRQEGEPIPVLTAPESEEQSTVTTDSPR
jgi:hypothetical protein